MRQLLSKIKATATIPPAEAPSTRWPLTDAVSTPTRVDAHRVVSGKAVTEVEAQCNDPAVAAVQPQEAVCQEASIEKGVGLILHGLRRVGPGGGFKLGEEGRGVLLRHVLQRGLLGAVTPVLDRGAIERPAGLPTHRLHALLPRF